MTLSEFKAWFEGYTEGLEGAPTKAQFDRIKEKVKEISGTPVTYPIYVDRWVQPYRPYWDRYRATVGMATGPTTYLGAVARNDGIGVANFASYGPERGRYETGADQTIEFDSHAAMYELGKMEATH